MRVIHPTSGNSPVGFLFPHIAQRLSRFADKTPYIDKARDMQCDITDLSKWKCESIPSFGHMSISQKAIELLWAYSYAYTVFCDVCLAGTIPNGGTIDLTVDPSVKKAMELLHWAVTEVESDGDSTYPLLMPSPTTVNRWAPVANALALHGIEFCLFHELAHLATDEKPTPFETETACDRQAWEWSLGSKPLTMQADFDRANGIVFALLLLTSHGIHKGEIQQSIHPWGIDRLMCFLRERIDPVEPRVWSTAMGILGLHFTNKNWPPPFIEADTFAQITEAYYREYQTRAAVRIVGRT